MENANSKNVRHDFLQIGLRLISGTADNAAVQHSALLRTFDSPYDDVSVVTGHPQLLSPQEAL